MSESNGFAEARKWKVAVLTISDKGAAGEREDKSGPLIFEMLCEGDFASVYEVAATEIIPDEQELIEEALIKYSDEIGVDLILTTGGTGFAARDVTPEATLAVSTRNAPGIAEAMRYESLKITARACLSRGASVIRNRTLIVNLPGSPKAAKENLGAVLPALSHGLEMLTGTRSECAARFK